MVTLDSVLVSEDLSTTELVTPTLTPAFNSLIDNGEVTVDSSFTISAEYPVYEYPYDMSFCNAGTPTINTLTAGTAPLTSLCYESTGSISLTITPPSISDPTGCTDTPWEYYFVLDASSVDSPLPSSPILHIDRATNTLSAKQQIGTTPESLPSAVYLVNAMAVEPTGKSVEAFQFTLVVQCCYTPLTMNPSANPTAFTY